MRAELTAQDLLARIQEGCPPAILDVRSAREFAAGHVPGAVHIPFWRVSTHLPDVPAAKQDEIVLYCGHGPRAVIAARALRRHGFNHLVYLAGHYSAWHRDGHPEERG